MAFKIPKTTLTCIAILIVVLVGLYVATNYFGLPKFLREDFEDEDEDKKRKIYRNKFDKMDEKAAKSGSVFIRYKNKTKYQCAALCNKNEECKGFQRSKAENNGVSSCKLSDKFGSSENEDNYFYQKN
tara:strand:- start:83 stop:466 length:384 start_codon:yes stop_codon:yes gene_type:complete